jgi:hypothetical protein
LLFMPCPPFLYLDCVKAAVRLCFSDALSFTRIMVRRIWVRMASSAPSVEIAAKSYMSDLNYHKCAGFFCQSRICNAKKVAGHSPLSDFGILCPRRNAGPV